MKTQLSQDYNVDGRYSFGKGSTDNLAGRRFVAEYLGMLRQQFLDASKHTPAGQELLNEDRFTVAGPGDSIYSFRNGFRATQ